MIVAYWQTHRPSRLACCGGWRPLKLSLHSSNEPGELSQWPLHDDSTINDVIGIIIMVALCNRADHYIFAL